MKQKASLLLDIVLGIVLIVIMYYILSNNYAEHMNESRISNATATTANIAAAVSQYRYEIGEYPESLDDLTKSGTQTADGEDASDFGPWIAKIEKDPWNNDYIYTSFAVNGNDDDTFVVYSKGKDDSGSFNQSTMEFSGGAIGSIGK